ncbi:hypothetical protein MKX01_041398 [Papaver californicum]|nr:hypothetical protein MKX01_041398 [Papaver californicum]
MNFSKKKCQSVKALIRGTEIAVTKEFLDCLPSLGCIVLTCVGLDNIDLDECKRRGISVGNAGTCYSVDVADFAIGLSIDVLRRISSADLFVGSGVGLGSIGSEVAKRLVPFNCIISYTSRNKKPSVPFSYYSNIVDLVSENDVLILTCEINKQNLHIINKDAMLALGKKGTIVNVGRGALVDENEMVQCLVQGEIGGVGLDVLNHPPHVPKELIEMGSVVLTPHNAVETLESYTDLHELVISNLEAFFSTSRCCH